MRKPRNPLGTPKATWKIKRKSSKRLDIEAALVRESRTTANPY